MSSDHSERSRAYMYRNQSKEEMLAFTGAYLMAACMKHSDPNVYRLYEGKTVDDAADRLSANTALFAIIIGMIDDHSLVTTLATMCKGEGQDALQAIKDEWEDGDADDKESNAHKAYYSTLFPCKLTADTTPEDFTASCNLLHTARTELSSTNRRITNEAHAANLIDWVGDIDAEYKTDVKFAFLSKTADQKRDHKFVQKTLTTVIRHRSNKVNSSNDKTSGIDVKTLKMAIKSDPSLLDDPDIRRMMGKQDDVEKKFEKKKCPKCGDIHWVNLLHPENCMTYMRACGKTPVKWDEKPADLRKKIDEKAEQLKKDLKGKDPKIALVRAQSPTSQTVEKSAGHTHLVLRLKSPASTVVQKPSIIYVDSQGGTEFPYHFIKDLHLFDHIDTSHPTVSIGGVIGQDAHRAKSQGLGSCTVDILTSGKPVTVKLDQCLYVPDLDDNIFNVWHGWHSHRVRCRFEDEPHVQFADGDTVAMLSDYTLRVVKHEQIEVRALDASVINRGKYGKTHIDAQSMSPMVKAEFELALQQLNDPAPDRAKALHNVMDNVPKILSKANYNNTATDARMLANAVALPAPESKTPMADRVGALTQMDGWDAGCNSLLGNRYMMDFVDAHSGDIDLYFAKKKSEFPSCTERYFLNLLQDCPEAIEKGGVLYSDNEKVLVSKEMKSVATKFKRTTETSIQYRATTNSLAETGFRLVPNEMRKIYVRTGVPKEFWEFVALEARRLLRWCRVRDGKTPGEIRTGTRADFNKFKDSTFGCRVIARIPVPWRENKHVPRSVSAVNLGRARNQPGYHIWCAEYGFMTSSDVTFFQHIFPFKTGTVTLRGSPAPSAGVAASMLAGPGGAPPPPAPGGPPPDDDDGDDGGFRDLHADGDGAVILPGGEVVQVDDDNDDDEVASLGDGDDSDDEDDDSGDSQRLDDEDSTNSERDGGSYVESSSGSVGRTKVLGRCMKVTALIDDAHEAILKHTSDRIEDHIAKIMGVKATKSRQSDPGWIPPPWFDLNSIRDEDIRDTWLAPDLAEIEGVVDKHHCAEEVTLDSLSTEQKNKIIGCLTPRVVKRSGKKKSRVVSRGDQMVQGVHYQRSHSPTIMHVSLRFLFALAAALNLKIIGGDFSQAYINADLPESEWYHMWPPKSARQYDADGKRLVWLVKKSLYGGKNAGRNWYLLLKDYLIEQGFEQCYCEPCVFFKRTDKGLLIIGAYVDDLVTLYSNEEEMQAVYADIRTRFDFTPQEPLSDICGIEVSENSEHIVLKLCNYITKMADSFLPAEKRSKAAHTPALESLPRLVDIALDQEPSNIDPKLLRRYRAIVGSILFASTTVRADIAYAAGMLSRAMSRPTPALLAAAERVVQYLYTTRDIGIHYSRNTEIKIEGSSDSDWAVRCSTSGYAFFVSNAIVAYLSKKQPTIAMSSAQAEIYAASLAGLEATFLVGFLHQVTGRDVTPVDIGVDSKAANDLSQDFVSNQRVRHFERRQLKIRELVERALVHVKSIGTSENVSDIFTKPLSKPVFEKHRRTLLNCG